MNPLRRNLLKLCAQLCIASSLLGMQACSTWTRVQGGVEESWDKRFTVQAPPGWVRYHPAGGVILTRDGLPIQHIRIMQHTAEEFFEHTKFKLPANVLPSDLAQLVLAALRADPQLRNLDVKAMANAQLGGSSGFKLHVQYRDAHGALFDRVILGRQVGSDVLLMSYHALHAHYFDRDLAVFYSVADSYRSLK